MTPLIVGAEILIERNAGGGGGGTIGDNTIGNNMDPNRADPRLVWLASVLTAMVVVVYLTQV